MPILAVTLSSKRYGDDELRTLAAQLRDAVAEVPDVSEVTLIGGRPRQLSVTIDPRTNSLLVGGTDRYVALVSEIIDSLDSSQAHERNSEVIRLRNSQAADVALELGELAHHRRD